MKENDVIHSLVQFAINAKTSGYQLTDADRKAISDAVEALGKIIRLKEMVEGTVDHQDTMDMIYEIKTELAVW
jgi:hypothetical protein